MVEPVVSVIVPMYNAEPYILAALNSILCERTIALEVIVVNDRSTDNSAVMVQTIDDDRIRLIEGPGRGAAAAMNAGYAAARGSIIMCCDADDYYSESRIRRQVDWLNKHPEFDGLSGAYSCVDEKGNLLATFHSNDSEFELTTELQGGQLRTSYCTFAVRSNLIRSVGKFREFFLSAYDIDFQLRLAEKGRIFFVPEQFYFYRINATSITHTQPSSTREFYEAEAFRLQRQRRSDGLDDLQKGVAIATPERDTPSVHTASLHAQELLVGEAWRQKAAGMRWSAIRTGLRALASHPSNIRSWKTIIALALKSAH